MKSLLLAGLVINSQRVQIMYKPTGANFSIIHYTVFHWTLCLTIDMLGGIAEILAHTTVLFFTAIL